MRIKSENIIINAFLFSMAFLPVVSLFWQDSLAMTNLKINWVFYPLVIVGIVLSVVFRNRAPREFIYFSFFTILYASFTVIRGGDIQGLLRFTVSVAPFVFLNFFYQQSASSTKWFWPLYCFSLCLPLYYSFLQYTGKMPYYEFDVVNGEYVGRTSGGYNKPMNFIAFLFPIYVLGFYFVKIRRKRVIGYFIIFLICSVLLMIGHRTSSLAFLIILASSFFSQTTVRLLYTYYKYYLNFIIGMAAFIALYFFQLFFGLIDGLRGRIPMWLAHAENFFNSSPLTIFFGEQNIQLHERYKNMKMVGSLQEAHNNAFRTIIFFGVAGFFFYCTFVRWMVLKVSEFTPDRNLLFIRYSCFLFLIFYSITNEPFYYTAILWPTLLWILPVEKKLGKNVYS